MFLLPPPEYIPNSSFAGLAQPETNGRTVEQIAGDLPRDSTLFSYLTGFLPGKRDHNRTSRLEETDDGYRLTISVSAMDADGKLTFDKQGNLIEHQEEPWFDYDNEENR